MQSLCHANCDECQFMENCKGCTATCGRPFGGPCVAAEYIRLGGLNAYETFKEKLRAEINGLLRGLELPEAEALYELPGSFVNLAYVLPGGTTAKFLSDRNVYLGTQIEFSDRGICYGVVADTGFILICSYSEGGSNPELILYKKR